MAVTIVDQNNLIVQVNPPARQTITIDKGAQGPQGPAGAPGPNTIGGYGITVSSPQNFDALMFRSTTNTWQNIPQTEIADGGNF